MLSQQQPKVEGRKHIAKKKRDEGILGPADGAQQWLRDQFGMRMSQVRGREEGVRESADSAQEQPRCEFLKRVMLLKDGDEAGGGNTYSGILCSRRDSRDPDAGRVAHDQEQVLTFCRGSSDLLLRRSLQLERREWLFQDKCAGG